MSGLIAVNVLLEPDAATKALVAELNAELRGGAAPDAGRVSGGAFAFDGTHLPHVTLLQRYVRSADLEYVFAAVGSAVGAPPGADVGGSGGADGATARPARFALRGGELGGGELGTESGTVLAGVELEPEPEVRALHDRVVRALTGFAVSGGSPAAFLRLAGEPPPNAETVAYVEGFVPAHAGERYTPHLTVGVAREAEVRRLARSHPLYGVPVVPVAVAVAHLGDLGTARKVLRRWPV